MLDGSDISRARPAIEVRELSHTYLGNGAGTVQALADLTLSVEEGEFCAVVGPSGCGKSTLLSCIAGLIEPTKGTIVVDGVSTTEAIRRRRIGIVFQDPCLLSWRTVRENVQLPLELGQMKDGTNEEIERVIRSVLLQGFENSYPSELSGGMRSRTAIARALASSPAVLLMDEPFGALDELTSHVLNLELLEIWRLRRPTIVLVTHNISQAVFVSDRVHVMTERPGRIAKTIDVTLPRPRNEATATSADFLGLVATVRNALSTSSELFGVRQR